MKIRTEYQKAAWPETKLILTCTPESTQAKYTYSWALTSHCQTRMAQRGLNHNHVLMALDFGQTIFKQGLTFYVVTRRSIPDHLNPKLVDKLDNLVVVVSDNGAIITCYKSKNGIKHIRRKTRQLYKANESTGSARMAN